MSALATPEHDSLRNPVWAFAAAGFLPWLLYAWSAPGYAYWLDSAEFTAAAVTLDIPHPPGHPLAQLWARTVCLLPLGPLPYRVAMAQALAGALGSGVLQVAFVRTLRLCGVAQPRVRTLSALAGAWCVSSSTGYWLQSVRAEVYALQTLLLLLALERMLRLAEPREPYDVRPLYSAAFCLGLGLANHHFMAVLALPTLLPGAWRGVRTLGTRVLWGCLGCGALGLSCYLYLPFRAETEPAMDLGHPASWQNFWWVVSAQVYARKIGHEAAQPFTERLADLSVIVFEQLSLVALLTAPLGLYGLLRVRALRAHGYVWSVTALLSLVGRAWLNEVRANPDVLGYMLPGFGAVVALGLTAFAMACTRFAKLRARVLAGQLMVFVLGAFAAAQLVRGAAGAWLGDFHATDEFAWREQAPLPPGAVVLRTSPEGAFRAWESAAVEQLRSDVTNVPLLFLNYGEVGARLLKRKPDLAELIRDFQAQASGALSRAAVTTLARKRPLFVEADTMACKDLYPYLLPAGVLYRVWPTPPSASQRERAGAARSQTLAALTHAVQGDLAQRETSRQLTWLHYIDAVYYLSVDMPQKAQTSVEAGLELAPHTPQLLALKRTLASLAKGARSGTATPR